MKPFFFFLSLTLSVACIKSSPVRHEVLAVQYGWTATHGTFCTWEYQDSAVVYYDAIMTTAKDDSSIWGVSDGSFQYTGKTRINESGKTEWGFYYVVGHVREYFTN